MPNRVNSDLSQILQAVQAKLLADNVFNNVYISLNPIQLQTPDDKFAVIVPGPQVFHQPGQTGGGRSLVEIDGKVQVIVWARLALDCPRRHAMAYQRQSRCLGTAEMRYQQSDNLNPTNQGGDYILGEPMRCLDVNVPQKTNLPGWGYVTSTWQIFYTQDLSCI